MSFPHYESYKDSGVEWLGEVPEEWQVIPLKRDLHFLTSGSRGWADYYAHDGALFIRIGNLTRESSRLDLSDIQRVAVPEGSEGERTVVRPGDVLFSITAYLGSVAVVPDDLELAYVSQHVALARLRSQYLLPEWVAYVTLSKVGKTYLETRGYGGTKIQLSLDDVANLTVTVPPIPEQTAIVDFLDWESAKIEKLISEQERLILLLHEKRRAVISHAVTKGLDPDIPMKDSGTEWLGEVPESWEVLQFTRLIIKIEQGWSPVASTESCEPDSWGVLKLGAIKNGVFIAGENKMLLAGIDPDPAIEVKPGDLLLTRGNTPELVGDACVVTEFVSCRLMLSDLVYRILLKPNNEPSFFCNLLISKYGRSLIETDARGSSMSMAKISQGHIGSWIIPVPPPEEQSAIVAFINAETAKIDALVAEAQRAIDLLKERRTALISAAVTGKIDVRGLVAQSQSR